MTMGEVNKGFLLPVEKDLLRLFLGLILAFCTPIETYFSEISPNVSTRFYFRIGCNIHVHYHSA